MLVILFALASYFYSASRQEFRIASNDMNQRKAELLADAGRALATAFLNHDAEIHRTYTSLDFAWRSYFNGAWAAGKPWAWRNDIHGVPGSGPPLTEGGLPEIDLTTYPEAAPDAQGDLIYVPRREDAGPVAPPAYYQLANPFVPVVTDDLDASPLGDLLTTLGFVPPPGLGDLASGVFTYPVEQVDTWTDVDNDGDQLNDSIWIPIPAERVAIRDGLDNDLDGLIDEGPQMGEDEIDNNLDGVIDDDVELTLAALCAPEQAIFLYDGSRDGLDNDRDGLIDEDKADDPTSPEYAPYDPDNPAVDADVGVFLTAPLIVRYFDPTTPTTLPETTADLLLPPATLTVQRIRPDGQVVPVTLTQQDIDALDNDYSLVVNDSRGYAYGHPAAAPPTVEQQRTDRTLVQSHVINDAVYFPTFIQDTFDPTGMIPQVGQITCSGEPVCDIVGRVAVLITDEAGKANINVAGGHAFQDNLTSAFLTRSIADGVSLREWELRTIPNIGPARGDYLWDLRTGATDGVGFESTGVFTFGANPPFDYDMSLPGYGRIDDNGNALWLSFNGLDDDGDAPLYQNDGIDNDLDNPVLTTNGLDDDRDGTIDEPDEGIDEPGEGAAVGIDEGFVPYDYNGDGIVEFAWPEGVDEPDELQQYRPLRDRLAESDAVDNDGNGAVDEIGEYGDRNLRTIDQMKLASQISGGIFDRLRNVVTTHSVDKNSRYQYYAAEDNSSGVPPVLEGERQLWPERSGSKLHYNYTLARDIGDALVNDWYYRPTWAGVDLDRGDTGSPTGIVPDGNPLNDFFPTPAEEVWHNFAMGLRQEGVSVDGVPWATWDAKTRLTIPSVNYPQPHMYPGFFAEDAGLRAYQLGANIEDFRDADPARTDVTTSVVDQWWDEIRRIALGLPPDDPGEQRPIRYTVSGVDTIRINEIMVRPVRRIEAEAITDPHLLYTGLASPFAWNPQSVQGPWLWDQPDPALNDFDLALPSFEADFALACLQFDPNLFSTMSVPDFDVDVRTLEPDIILDADPDTLDWEWFYPEAYEHQTLDPDDPLFFDRTEAMSWRRDGDFIGEAAAVYLPPSSTVTPTDPDTPPYTVSMSSVRIDVDDEPTQHDPEDGSTWTPFEAPNLVQFRFAPSPGLPPGRYYLLLNTRHIPLWIRTWILDVLEAPDLDADGRISAAEAAAFDPTITADVFASLDLNGDGFVTALDLEEGVTVKAGQEHRLRYVIKYGLAQDERLVILLRTGDANQDGLVTFAEARAIYPALTQADFDSLDTNGDGVLTGADTWERDIIDGLRTGTVNLTGSQQQPGALVPYSNPIVGLDAQGRETGWVMLPSSSVPMGRIPQWVRELILRLLTRADANGDGYVTLAEAQAFDPTITDAIFSASLDTNRDGVVSRADLGYPGYWQDYANTVVIPPYNPADQQYLYVAVWKGDRKVSPDGTVEDPFELAVNFFDFSQEPDHEWVEIVNIAETDPNKPPEDQVTDISGWQLEVSGNASNHGRIVATVPGDPSDPNPANHTVIAPGGSLLLGFDKFDPGAQNFVTPPETLALILQLLAFADADGNGEVTLAEAQVFDPTITDVIFASLDLNQDGVVSRADLDVSAVFKNGIALASGTRDTILPPWMLFPGEYPAISEPPFPNYDPVLSQDIWPGLPVGYTGTATDTIPPDPSLAGASVFYRPVDRDFVERNSDGADDFFQDLDGDGVPDSAREDLVNSTPYDGLGSDKAWDRIVELKTPVLDDIRDLPGMARWILGGGIFPNYPEHDALDNDGDNAVLEHDGVDNNGDGPVDKRPDWALASISDLLANADINPQDGTVTLAEAQAYNPALTASYFAVLDINADHVLTTADLRPGEGIDEGRWPADLAAPGSFSDRWVIYGCVFGDLDPTDPDYAYLGTADDPPKWKEFVERRFFPGDNVIVTLYAGYADTGRVVDRVTYNERDVVNASISDLTVDASNALVECPYFVDDNGNYTMDPEELRTLDWRYPTMWPNDTMGADFYRSLERKHPLYDGDRFGTQNRWDPTDGNYDDWAPNMGAAGVFEPAGMTDWLATPASEVEFGHAMQGSPLRMNVTQRVIDGWFPATPGSQVQIGGDGLWRPTDDVAGLFRLAAVHNRNLISPGELATVPHVTLTATLRSNPGDPLLSEESVSGVMIGEGTLEDLAPLLTSGSHDAIVLTCAQADFYPITPTATRTEPAAPPGIVENPALVTWGGPNALPQAWTPVFLYALDPAEDPGTIWVPAAGPMPVVTRAGGVADLFPYLPDDFPVGLLFLFNGPGGPAVPAHALPANLTRDDLRVRSSLPRRATMYVSSNLDSFDPALDHAATGNASEALFVWNGEDGVENGEYDVFVAVGDDLSKVPRSPLLTAFGAEMLAAAANTYQSQMVADVEFFADRDGDRTVWTDQNSDGLPQYDELNREYESFGLIPELTPGSDGLVHYGTVDVQYNEVALFLRNWSQPGKLNRFSRIVLTPRQRTTGRININTATTREVEENSGPADFNALLGIPGVLEDYEPGSGIVRWFDDADWMSPSDPAFAAAIELARRIARGKPYWSDGRYYRFPSDLIAVHEDSGVMAFARILDFVTSEDPDASQHFREVVARYTRMANLITTRSDVFEIIVTAQPGYGVDANGDGFINYRSDDEFIVEGEKKVRTVYERRER